MGLITHGHSHLQCQIVDLDNLQTLLRLASSQVLNVGNIIRNHGNFTANKKTNCISSNYNILEWHSMGLAASAQFQVTCYARKQISLIRTWDQADSRFTTRVYQHLQRLQQGARGALPARKTSAAGYRPVDFLWSKMAAKNDKRQRYSIHLYTLHIFSAIFGSENFKIGTPQT